MKSKFLLYGVVLATTMFQGCSSPTTIDEAVATYSKLETEIKQYEPVGDEKLDSLARPFVTGALQLKADVDKEAAAIEGNPIRKKLGSVAPENVEAAFAALPAEERNAIEKFAAASKASDGARLDNLAKQLTDLAKAGAKLAIEIQDASSGGAGGTAGLASSVFKAGTGPGGKAAAQVSRSVDFCPAAEAMIRNYRSVCAEVEKSIESNARKAQS